MKRKYILSSFLCVVLQVFAQTTPTIYQDCSKNGVKINLRSSSSNGIENGHEYVDLGLSVYWSNENLSNVAWGETSTKSSFYWNTYKYGSENDRYGYCTTLTKYITDSKYGTIDNKTILDLSDDAAHVQYGGKWRMPTQAEMAELLSNCGISKNDGLYNGYTLTSMINGAKIHFRTISYSDGGVYYWTRNLDASTCTKALIGSVYISYSSFCGHSVYSRERCKEGAVKAVCPKPHESEIFLSTPGCTKPDTILCYLDSSYSIMATANKGCHFVKWSDGNTSNPRSITVSANATYTAEFAPNECKITTSATNGIVYGAGTYNFNTSVTLTATPNEHYHFVKWSDGNTSNPRAITVTKDSTFTAIFAGNDYTLLLDLQGAYNGTNSVKAQYGSAMPKITIPTRVGYTFGGIYAETNGGGTQYYTADGKSAKNWDKAEKDTLYAKWVKQPHILFNNNYPGSNKTNLYYGDNFTNSDISGTYNKVTGTTTMNGTLTYHYYVSILPLYSIVANDTVSIKVYDIAGARIPNSGNNVIDYSNFIGAPPTTRQYLDWKLETVSMKKIISDGCNYFKLHFWWNNEDVTYSNFQYKVCIEKGSTISTIPSPSGFIVTQGSTYGNLPTPTRAGYTFDGWYTAATGGTKITSTSIVSFTDTQVLYAHWTAIIYTIKAESNNTDYGTVTGAGTYNYNTNVTLTATPNEHYHFVKWSDGNTSNPRTITVTKDSTFTAVFAIDQFTITATSEHGTVTGSGMYNYGAKATLTATNSDCYSFQKWSDGFTDNPRSVVVTQDSTFTAIFVGTGYQETVNCTVVNESPYGTVSFTGMVIKDSNISLQATAPECSKFVKWSDNDTSNPRSLAVDQDTTLTAIFEKVQFNITLETEDESKGEVDSLP